MEGSMHARSIRNGSVRCALSVLGLAFLVFPLAPAAAQEGAKVGNWKTWVIASGSEIAVPAPPADISDQTKVELDQLRQFQALRSPTLGRVIDFWNAVPTTQRWTDATFTLMRQGGLNPVRQLRVLAHVHAAMYDAVVTAYHAKYAYNRKAPSALAPDLKVAVATVEEPSYPSEHAAVAGAAAGVLAAFFPKEAAPLAAMAQEAANSRLLAGANYRSDVEAGLTLGRAVAEKVNMRATTDGSDAQWTGTVPTGDGLWVGTNPLEPLAGTWKPWMLTANDQFRPVPPPAFGSAEFLADLAEVKRINASPTAAERAIATFWATNGSAAPFWEAASLLIARERLSTPRAARVLALLGVAAADANIAEWEAKYHYWRIRPSQADPTITPIVPLPNFPSYPAGLPGIGGMSGDILAYFFPQDAQRLRYMEEEGAVSRLYGGVHFRSDSEAGLALGRGVAALAIQRDRMNDN
jgi:membrane-associated phospholipid phosphatase